MPSLPVGVLALQGDYAKHLQALTRCGEDPVKVRSAEELSRCRGLILPGGESTTIAKLLQRYGIFEPIQKAAAAGLPIFGTCAGLVLMAETLIRYPDQPTLKILKLDAERNAYGRQIESFEATLMFHREEKEIPAVFIRAPRIRAVHDSAIKTLVSFNNEPVMVQKEALLAASFHPELTEDLTIHRYFLDLCR